MAFEKRARQLINGIDSAKAHVEAASRGLPVAFDLGLSVFGLFDSLFRLQLLYVVLIVEHVLEHVGAETQHGQGFLDGVGKRLFRRLSA